MSIYHYTKLATLIEYILPTKTLRSNGFSQMNDPRESRRWSMGSINLPLDTFFPNYYSNETHIECQFKFGQMIKDSFQVICFSGAKNEGWKNEMMWTHYAENQRGVCLEFCENNLTMSVRDKFPEIKFILQDVNYTKKNKEKPWIFWDENLSKDENFDNYLSVLCNEVVFHKSHFWEKEDEKRLLFLNQTENVYLPYGKSLKAIHLGVGFPLCYVPAIEELIKDTSINLYRLIYERDEYIRWRLSRKEGKLWTSTGEDD